MPSFLTFLVHCGSSADPRRRPDSALWSFLAETLWSELLPSERLQQFGENCELHFRLKTLYQLYLQTFHMNEGRVRDPFLFWNSSVYWLFLWWTCCWGKGEISWWWSALSARWDCQCSACLAAPPISPYGKPPLRDSSLWRLSWSRWQFQSEAPPHTPWWTESCGLQILTRSQTSVRYPGL